MLRNRVTWSVLAVLLGSAPVVSGQTTSTWPGGAGNWEPCPQDNGTALWDTCAGDIYPNGNAIAIVNGGTVTVNDGIGVVDLSVAGGASVVISPGYIDITGNGNSIVNNGSISIGSGDGLGILESSVTLTGNGAVTMMTSDAVFRGTAGSPGPTLINQSHIQGQGSLAIGLNITNQGTINANAGTLSVEPTTLVNTGLLEASSGSTLALIGSLPAVFNNTGGTIKALSGGTVQLQGNTWSGGTLVTAGTGVIQATGSVILTNLTNSGKLQMQAASVENTITNSGVIQLSSGTLNASGNPTLTGTGSMVMSGTAVLRPLGSTDTLTSLQLIHGSGTISALGLTNQATIAADSSGNTLAFFEGITTNQGTIEASGGGILSIQNTIANAAGTVRALNASTVTTNGTIQGGTLTTSGTGVIDCQDCTLDGTVNVPTNSGHLNVNNSDLFLQGTINNNGAIALTGNSCAVMNQATTITGSGKLTMASSTCIDGAGNPFTNQSNIAGSGSIGDSNPMPISNAGTIVADQPLPLIIHPNATGFSNTGKLVVNAGSTLNINGVFNNLSNGTLTGGTYNVTGTLGIPNAVVDNAAAITLTGSAAEIFNANNAVNALSTLAANDTTGTLALGGGQALSTSTGLTNAGKVTVAAGSSLSVGGGYTQTAGTTAVDGSLAASGHLILRNGLLRGQGTLAATVVCSAALTAGESSTTPGKLTVTGGYMQNATGILNVAVSGTQVGSGYSQLAISGGASLNGTLNITLAGGFIPGIGSAFTILTGHVVTGQFSTVNGLSINSGEHFEISYPGNAVVLTVASGS